MIQPWPWPRGYEVPRVEKEQAVLALHEKLKRSRAGVLAAFSGLTVSQMEELRKDLRREGVEFLVVKNTLVRRAARGTGFAKLEEHFVGPTALALSPAASAAPARVLTDYIKRQPKLTIKGGLVGELALSESQVRQLAVLPGREVLLARLLGMLKSPMARLVTVLAGPSASLVRALDAVAKKKGSG